MIGDYQHIDGTCWVRPVCLDMMQLKGAFLQLFHISVYVLDWNLSCYDPTTPVLATKEQAVTEGD